MRSIGTLMLLTVLINTAKPNFIEVLTKSPILYWAIWIGYAFINTMQLGYNWDLPYYSFIIVLTAPLLVLWLINDESYRDREILFNVIIAGLFLRIFMIFLFDSSRSYDVGRFGDKIDSNDLGISAVILVIFMYLKYLYEEYGLVLLVSLIAFPIYMIVISGSRNALAGLSIIFLAHFVIHRNKDKFTNLSKLVIGALLMYGTYLFLINNTYLGQRLAETAEQNSEANYQYDLTGTIFEKFGDRGIFYVQGWELFKEHPISGIGLGNYSEYSFEGLVLHSEYMIQLCELGIIGSIIFLFYYGWFLKNIVLAWKNDLENRKIIEAFIFGLIIIFFMGFSMFQYSNPIYFLLTGTIIAFITRKKEYPT